MKLKASSKRERKEKKERSKGERLKKWEKKIIRVKIQSVMGGKLSNYSAVKALIFRICKELFFKYQEEK